MPPVTVRSDIRPFLIRAAQMLLDREESSADVANYLQACDGNDLYELAVESVLCPDAVVTREEVDDAIKLRFIVDELSRLELTPKWESGKGEFAAYLLDRYDAGKHGSLSQYVRSAFFKYQFPFSWSPASCYSLVKWHRAERVDAERYRLSTR